MPIQNRYLWTSRRSVEETLQSEPTLDEVKERLTEDNTNFINLLRWLRVAYSENEVIKILLDCGYDRNLLPTYGFSKDDIVAVLDEYDAEENYEEEDDDE